MSTRTLILVSAIARLDTSTRRLVEELAYVRDLRDVYLSELRSLEATDRIRALVHRHGHRRRQWLPLSSFSLVLLRPSPPFDLAQVNALRLLAASVGPSVAVINSADVLLRWTSKTVLVPLVGATPRSIVTADESQLMHFLERRSAYAKQLHRAEGRGVVLVPRRDPTEATRKLSLGYRSPILLQEVVHSTKHRRVWMVDGGTVATADTSDVSRPTKVALRGRLARVAEHVGDHLRRLGIRLAAVDFVGNKAIEANICRPGLIAEYERATGTNLAREIVRRLVG